MTQDSERSIASDLREVIREAMFHLEQGKLTDAYTSLMDAVSSTERDAPMIFQCSYVDKSLGPQGPLTNKKEA